MPAKKTRAPTTSNQPDLLTERTALHTQPLDDPACCGIGFFRDSPQKKRDKQLSVFNRSEKAALQQFSQPGAINTHFNPAPQHFQERYFFGHNSSSNYKKSVLKSQDIKVVKCLYERSDEGLNQFIKRIDAINKHPTPSVSLQGDINHAYAQINHALQKNYSFVIFSQNDLIINALENLGINTKPTMQSGVLQFSGDVNVKKLLSLYEQYILLNAFKIAGQHVYGSAPLNQDNDSYIKKIDDKINEIYKKMKKAFCLVVNAKIGEKLHQENRANLAIK